jgi:hypothetical protein
MKCSTEEAPLEVTEDCWVPPPVSQSFVACKWGSHSLHPDASSFPYCQVKWLHLWPNKASECCSICCHARMQLMPPLKVPGVSRCLITSLLQFVYNYLLFIHVYIIYKYQFIAKLQMVAFGNSHLLLTLQMDANQCVTSRGYPGPLFSISLYHYQVKGN